MSRRKDFKIDLKKAGESSQNSESSPIELPHLVESVKTARPIVRMVEISRIIPNPDQPRKHFPEESLKELAASIEEKGVLQPIAVKVKDDLFELVFGERRWRAAKLAGLPHIPARIYPQDETIDDIALIENIHRENLFPEDYADAVRRFLERHGYTQEEAGKKLGLDRTQISRSLTVARFLDNTGAIEALQAVRQRGTLIHFELLYSAASRKTIEEGIMLLNDAAKSERGMSVRSIRTKIGKGSTSISKQWNGPRLISHLRAIRKRLDIPMPEDIDAGTKKDQVVQEIAQSIKIFEITLKQLRNAQKKLQE